MTAVGKTLIVGSGPAGLTAGIYAARAGLNPLLIEGGEPGGQLTQTPEIGNWPGAKDQPSGYELIDSLTGHAKALGVRFISGEVVSCSLQDKVKKLTLDNGTVLEALTVIIATGAQARYLNVKGEDQYKGAGVSACATCDGFFFKGKDVAVVGGGSAAFVEALYLTTICNKVYLVHRREGFRAEQVLIDRLQAKAAEGKAEFVLNATVDEVVGDGTKVTGLVLNVQGEKRSLQVDGVFAAVGHTPATGFLRDSGVILDESGYIVLKGGERESATSVAGVFAAGDCADKVYRQAITSAGTGCKAALDAEHYLLENS